VSWFSPLPPDLTLRLPTQIPKTVVPSFIGENGQVLNLLFHHGSGNIARDYSELTNHGTIYGASWVEGSWGWALIFTADNNYVEVPDDPSLDFTASFSILCWINYQLTALTHDHVLIGKTTVANSSDGYQLKFGYGRDLRLPIGGNADIVYTYPSAYLNEWHHVAGVYDGTDRQLFVDGSLVASDSPAVAVPTNNLPLRVGMRYQAGTYFEGFIGIVVVYNRALSPTEVRNHYELQKSIFQ